MSSRRVGALSSSNTGFERLKAGGNTHGLTLGEDETGNHTLLDEDAGLEVDHAVVCRYSCERLV